MDTLTAITTRRSIRNYTGEELDIGLIKELLQYALYAPSAHNQQSWKYYIVSKKEDRKFLSEVMEF
jgi:nitroreductase